MVQDTAREEVLEVGLTYSTDQNAGYGREKTRRGLHYVDISGNVIGNEMTLKRIGLLVIPPAWTDVWICPSPQGYLQATGKDAKGRRQSIYHPDWIEHRERTKFDRLAEFGRALPRLRQAVKQDLARHGLPKEKVVATVVRLLEQSLIRVGNRQYARDNHSFGLTTLENRHVSVSSTSVKFSFRGKSGKYHKISLSDRRIAGIVRRCQELPGQCLFEYLDSDARPGEVTSADVNEYIHRTSGSDFTAKDFRTWSATVEAVRQIRLVGNPTEKDLKEVVKVVAAKLGNTPSVCRKAYIHPAALLDLDKADWIQRRGPDPADSRTEAMERFVLKYVLPKQP